MQTGQRQSPLAPLRRALARREGGGLSDAELLGRFLARQDEAAFEVLVRRHGAMVLGVCRRVLGHAQDAEDAFQATFLVLVRRAAAIRKRDAVGNWLYGVAYRTALEARAAVARRHATEKQVSNLPEPAIEPTEPAGDLRALLDAELARLPDKYRAALVICDLQGHARREAARQLGIPEGTLSSRLAAGRRLLADRLARRGVTLSAAALATSLSAPIASAAVPAPLVQATVGAAATFAAGEAGIAAVSVNVLVLTQKVVRAMLLTKVKFAIPFVLALTLLGAGAGSIWTGAAGREPVAGAQPADRGAAPDGPEARLSRTAKQVPLKEAQEVWALELKFKDPRVLTVDLPGRGKKAVWYLWYEVINRTGEPRFFIPDFELVIPGKKPVHRDEVIPQAEDAIGRVEDPTGLLSVKNSVTMAAEPIAPTRAGAPKRPVVGVAIWADVPPDASRFTVFVSGLSNGWVLVEPTVADKAEAPAIHRKTLRLSFKRVDRQVVFASPAEWVYRLTKLKMADQADKGGGADRKPVPGPRTKSEAERLEADIDQARRQITQLERQARHWEKREQRADWVRALYQLQLLRARLLGLEARLREIRGGKAKPPHSGMGPEVRGKIQKVQGDLLQISVGADDAVRRGEWLEIYRLHPRPEYVGRAEILEVQAHFSVARLLRRLPTQDPRVGDEVTREIR